VINTSAGKGTVGGGGTGKKQTEVNCCNLITLSINYVNRAEGGILGITDEGRKEKGAKGG